MASRVCLALAGLLALATLGAATIRLGLLPAASTAAAAAALAGAGGLVILARRAGARSHVFLAACVGVAAALRLGWALSVPTTPSSDFLSCYALHLFLEAQPRYRYPWEVAFLLFGAAGLARARPRPTPGPPALAPRTG
jgi:hypothetical protein